MLGRRTLLIRRLLLYHNSSHFVKWNFAQIFNWVDPEICATCTNAISFSAKHTKTRRSICATFLKSDVAKWSEMWYHYKCQGEWCWWGSTVAKNRKISPWKKSKLFKKVVDKGLALWYNKYIRKWGKATENRKSQVDHIRPDRQRHFPRKVCRCACNKCEPVPLSWRNGGLSLLQSKNFLKKILTNLKRFDTI